MSPDTNINPALQYYLENKINQSNSPIAGIAVVDIETAAIIALAEGRSAKSWKFDGHSATYAGFPAASLFKSVSAVALIDQFGFDGNTMQSLTGGCKYVTGRSNWLRDVKLTKKTQVSLLRAYGVSCNRYFAKTSIEHVGFKMLNEYILKLGWNSHPSKIADFQIMKSPIQIPNPNQVSTQNFGKFAAGFGKVGLSPVHAAWQMMTIIKQGRQTPLRMFRKTALPKWQKLIPTLKPHTPEKFVDLLNYSVRRGSADYIGKKRKYRRFSRKFGGKTGTLTGEDPFGLVTWFAGVYPLDRPKYAVAAVVVLDGNLWFAKGPDLAAEAIWAIRNPLKIAQNFKKFNRISRN